MERKNKKDRTIHKYFGLLMILILGCIVGYSMKPCKTCDACPEGEYERGVFTTVSNIYNIVAQHGYVTLYKNNETMYLVPIEVDLTENPHIKIEETTNGKRS